MQSLWRSLRSYEELTRNEILLCDALQTKLMHDHNLNERKMIYTIELLLRSLLLYQGGHLLNVLAHEVGDIHHPHPGKVHQ